MSEPGDEKPKAPAVPEPSPWISREGDVVHPGAPAGSGGLGRFRVPGALGADGNDTFDVRHPGAPSVRFEPLSGEEKAEVLGGGVKVIEKERNPPPTTVPGKQSLKKVQPTFDLDVTIEILADDAAGTISGARTELNGSSVNVTGIEPVYRVPEGETKVKPTDKVIELKGKATISGTATIQVVYGTVGSHRVRPEEEAAWGRGTTPADVTAKNITVGFHESCHRDDYVAYLKGHLPIQDARFKVGMTSAEYDKEEERIQTAINDWLGAAESTSRAKTDETGTKMSDYVASHPGTTGH